VAGKETKAGEMKAGRDRGRKKLRLVKTEEWMLKEDDR